MNEPEDGHASVLAPFAQDLPPVRYNSFGATVGTSLPVFNAYMSSAPQAITSRLSTPVNVNIYVDQRTDGEAATYADGETNVEVLDVATATSSGLIEVSAVMQLAGTLTIILAVVGVIGNAGSISTFMHPVLVVLLVIGGVTFLTMGLVGKAQDRGRFGRHS